MNLIQRALPLQTRCSVRLQTCVVSLIFFLFSSVIHAGIIDARVLQETIKKEIKKKYGQEVRVEEIRVHLSKPLGYRRLVSQEVELRLRKGFPSGTATVRIRTDGWRRIIGASVKVRWRCERHALAEDVRRGERIFPWQVKTERGFFSECVGPLEGDLFAYINYVAVRDLRRGEVLKKGLLRKVPLIRRGDRVTIVYRKGNLEITFTGRALEKGFYRELVRVRSDNTGRILKGEVVSEGSVLIRE